MREIIEAGYALHHWFSRHNIDKEGVRVVIQLPSDLHKHHAEMALKLDSTPDMVTDYDALRRGETTVCGFPLAFETKK